MRNGKSWNLNWHFTEGYSEEMLRAGYFEGKPVVHLPHTVKELPYNYFSHDATAMISTYEKTFELTKEDARKRSIVEFEGVMAYFDLYVNGSFVGNHKGGYSRVRMEITSYVRPGKNTMIVVVDSHEREDIPPFGFVIDYLTYGGIYRDVNFYSLEDTFIDNLFFRYEMEGETAVVYPEFFIDNKATEFKGTLCYSLSDENGEIIHCEKQDFEIEPGKTSITMPKHKIDGLRRWDIVSPTLYSVHAWVEREGVELDACDVRAGFRTMECKPDGFYLNGEYTKIVGMDRHQSYPYVGYAMGKRAQRADADILKEYNFNGVRTSHYMQSKYFLDRCDELGILVFEEIPGWGHIGGDEFKKVVLQDVRAMIEADYNHPSIFLWGVRLNESADDDVLYTKTNAIAHELDPSRCTGGVRYMQGSSFLEDVYTYNDFCHADDPGLDNVQLMQRDVTKLNRDVPYMVTEYMGHTYPTKPFDNEIKRDEHARRHARILARTLLRRDSLGSFGWCAFDYNTHGDCGSGDKICYHGIFDMFRVPKYAAWVYRSQKPVTEEVILQPLTNFARGEKDLNGITPFLVATNCDFIEVYMYGKSVGFYYPSDKFFGLPHPLIEVTFNDKTMWNIPWQDGKIVGYVNGQPVTEYYYARDAYLDKIEVKQETDVISSKEVDTCRFEVTFRDQYGNPCEYINSVLHFELEGDIELIGPEYVAPVGGHIAFWVRSVPNGADNEATVRISAIGVDQPTQEFHIRHVSCD
ncbi:MAG: glycoside hydrolase family 2 protein [Oscillospiraceae bacterium]|nr:glycoside hydrolase family 2 protein [Oscillospiraceae bacterium]